MRLVISDPPKTATGEKIAITPIQESKPLPVTDVAVIAQRVIENIEKVIVGKHEQVNFAVATLLAEGHLLIQDIPGVAKTMLARAIAQSVGGSFKRIQCTPDLLPTDVLGAPFTVPETGKVE